MVQEERISSARCIPKTKKELCTDEQLDHADKLVVLEDSIVVMA
jgi:hypothetical protein